MRKTIKNPSVILSILLVIISVRPTFGITIAEEEALSREFMKNISHRFDYVKDPYIVAYVKTLGKRIVDAFPPQPFKYHFYVLNIEGLNAFATPAGHIFVFSGLIESLDTEEELAGILAHEVAHVHCRHISQKIDRSSKINIATLAAVAAGLFLGLAGAGAAAQALTIGSMAGGQSLELAFSREDEIQADQVGLPYMEKAGYRAESLMAALTKIRSQQWFGSDQIPSYLSTHPAVEDRLAYIDSWVQQHSKTNKRAPSTLFKEIQTRLIALYSDEKKAFSFFESNLRKDPNDIQAEYGMALTLDRIGDRKGAVEHLRRVLEKNPLDPMVLTDLGKIYFFDGRMAEAKTSLEGAVTINYHNPEAQFYLGRVQLQLGEYEKAVDTLEWVIKQRASSNEVYYFLGEAYGKFGELANAHYYLGYYYHKKRNLKNALFHYQKSYETIEDPEKREHIETVLPKIRSESKKLSKQ
jgi:predicted Zn-dependent protease